VYGHERYVVRGLRSGGLEKLVGGLLDGLVDDVVVGAVASDVAEGLGWG